MPKMSTDATEYKKNEPKNFTQVIFNPGSVDMRA